MTNLCPAQDLTFEKVAAGTAREPASTATTWRWHGRLKGRSPGRSLSSGPR
jgi:hypothetical protein